MVYYVTSCSSEENLVMISKPGSHVVGIQDGHLQVILYEKEKFEGSLHKHKHKYIRV